MSKNKTKDYICSNKPYTKITFNPDLEIFGLKNYR